MIRLIMKPFSKARPRVTVNGTYMPPKYTADKKTLRELYLATGYRNIDFKGKPVNVEMMFCYPIPKSWSRKMKEELDHRRIRADVDNLAGGVFDALNGVAWNDDKDIVSLVCSKRYSEGGESIFLSIKEVT